jgi:Zn-finger nucleic acid-binding protein
MDAFCPLVDCRAALALTEKPDAFDVWICPNGHGMAATITELWKHIQDDEIRAIWQAAKGAPKNDRKSPVLGTPMVTVTISVDSDEEQGNSAADAKELTLDVAPDEEFVWFDAGELEMFASDLPNPEPSADEKAKVKELADHFAESWVAANRNQLHKGLAGKLRTMAEHFAE